MAADFCLLPDKVEDFKKALKDKTLDLAALLDPKMTSEARTEIFRTYAGDAAGEVNKLFESKLVLKNRIEGIKRLVAKLGESGKYSPEGKAALAKAAADYRAAQQERIFNPKEHEAFLNDLADKAIGTHISKDVANKVFELSAKADALRDVNPKMSGVSDEYLQARNQLNAYVATQKNTSVVKSIGRNLATIGRNNLLFNPATPIKTVIGQTVNSAMDMITRRISAMSLGGAASDVARAANKEAWQTYMKTGVNTASLENLADTGLNKLGERMNFADVPGSNATGVAGAIDRGVGKVAQVSNKIVIDWEHNIAFTKFYQKAFFDTANVIASKIAKDAGLDAKAVMADAVRIEPTTREGAVVRMEAQRQAARITSTNPTYLSRLSLGAKNWLNSVTPDFPLGDILVPIAKIPANIIANGIENAGPGIPLGIRDIVQGRTKIASDDLGTRYQGMAQMANGYQRLTRTLGVMGAAAYFASGLSKKDFRTDQYGNHFVNISGVWINTEYIAAFSPALAGMMSVKEHAAPGDGLLEAAGHYVTGGLQELKRVPGIDEAEKLVTAVTNSNFTKGIMKYAKDLFTSRGEPAFIRSLLSNSPIEHLLFGAHGVQSDAEVRQDEMDAARKRALSRQGASQ